MLTLFRLTPASSRAPLISRLNSPTCLQPSNSASRPSNSFDLRSLSTFPSRSPVQVFRRFQVVRPFQVVRTRTFELGISFFRQYSRSPAFSYLLARAKSEVLGSSNFLITRFFLTVTSATHFPRVSAGKSTECSLHSDSRIQRIKDNTLAPTAKWKFRRTEECEQLAIFSNQMPMKHASVSPMSA